MIIKYTIDGYVFHYAKVDSVVFDGVKVLFRERGTDTDYVLAVYQIEKILPER